MRDVDRALDEIGRFATLPPIAPRGRGEIQERAAVRRRRKRVGGAGVAAACIVAVAFVAAAWVGDGGREVARAIAAHRVASRRVPVRR